MHADRRLVANPESPGWKYIEDRRDVPALVAMVRATGRSMLIGPEAVATIEEWLARTGWGADEGPVRLGSVDNEAFMPPIPAPLLRLFRLAHAR
jgi:hypothetical protein